MIHVYLAYFKLYLPKTSHRASQLLYQEVTQYTQVIKSIIRKVRMRIVTDDDLTYCGDYFVMYTDIESLLYT